MRQILSYTFTAFLLTLLSVSCSRTGDGNAESLPAGIPEEGPAAVELSFSAVSPALSSAPAAFDCAVRDVQLLVFGGDTVVYHRADSAELRAGRVTATAGCGYRDIRLLANGPDVSQVTSLREWEETVVTLSDHESAFVMTAAFDRESVGAVWKGDATLRRLLSRVRLMRVTRRMTGEEQAALPMRIERVYLTNVTDGVRLDGTRPEPGRWRAFPGEDSALCVTEPFLFSALPEPVLLPQGGHADLDLAFYTCPTPYTSDDDRDWQRYRVLRLVVECRADVNGDGLFAPEESFVYPMPLGELLPDRSYDVAELVVTRLGNASDGDDFIGEGEDNPMRFPSMTFDVVTAGWDIRLWNGDGRWRI